MAEYQRTGYGVGCANRQKTVFQKSAPKGNERIDL